MRKLFCLCFAFLFTVVFGSSPNAHAQIARTAVGADAAAIQTTVDQFRADLGISNGVGPCNGTTCLPGVGRREVNWDGVGDAASSPNVFPGDFFNQATGGPAGRIRGIEFSTTGTFEVSADSDSDGDGTPGPVATLFGNHSPDNADDFAAFSAERIFGIVGSNELDVTFSLPGSPDVPALVKGFGAVFTDVELAGATKLEFFDGNDQLIHTENALAFATGPSGESLDSFSFVGVSFDDAVVSRVHITNGGFDLNLVQIGLNDSVAMDDFIFGEPISIPEPSALVLVMSAVTWAGVRRIRS